MFLLGSCDACLISCYIVNFVSRRLAKSRRSRRSRNIKIGLFFVSHLTCLHCGRNFIWMFHIRIWVQSLLHMSRCIDIGAALVMVDDSCRAANCAKDCVWICVWRLVVLQLERGFFAEAWGLGLIFGNGHLTAPEIVRALRSYLIYLVLFICI